MPRRIHSMVSIDDVLYPIYEDNGKFSMRYAGIDLHPIDNVDALLEAFVGHEVLHYKSTEDFRKWYEGIVEKLKPKKP